jgi:hypothetical protein
MIEAPESLGTYPKVISKLMKQKIPTVLATKLLKSENYKALVGSVSPPPCKF